MMAEKMFRFYHILLFYSLSKKRLVPLKLSVVLVAKIESIIIAHIVFRMNAKQKSDVILME